MSLFIVTITANSYQRTFNTKIHYDKVAPLKAEVIINYPSQGTLYRRLLFDNLENSQGEGKDG